MNLKERMVKKGLSPVIATVLLIAMVIVIGTLIFLWFKGMQKEALTKFEGRNIERVCEDVNFNVDYLDGELSLVNNGNVPIQDLEIKDVSSSGSYSTKTMSDYLGDKWDGLKVGESISESESISFSGEKISVSPVLIGNTEYGEKKSYSCDPDKYGKTINI